MNDLLIGSYQTVLKSRLLKPFLKYLKIKTELSLVLDYTGTSLSKGHGIDSQANDILLPLI